MSEKEYIIFLGIKFEVDENGIVDIGDQIRERFWSFIKEGYKKFWLDQPIRSVKRIDLVQENINNAKKWQELMKLLKENI